MTISDTDKLDLLWKHIAYGVAKTADAGSKAGSNETIASPTPVFDSHIWTLASQIPGTAPSGNTAIVACHVQASAIELSADPTAPQNMTWLSPVQDIIPPSFGVTYAPKVSIGNPASAKTTRLYPDTAGEEWVLDPNAGVLLFPNATPVSKETASGDTVTLATDGLYLEVYAYVGPKGFPVAAEGPTTSLVVTPQTVSPTQLGELLAGTQVLSIAVSVDTAFDGNLELMIGDGKTADLYLGSAHADLAYPGVYVVTPQVLPADAQIVLSSTGSATVGSASIKLHYS